jgi:hypothetical protein
MSKRRVLAPNRAPRDGTSMPRTVDRPTSGVDWTGPCARQSLSAGRTSRH